MFDIKKPGLGEAVALQQNERSEGLGGQTDGRSFFAGRSSLHYKGFFFLKSGQGQEMLN